MLMYWGKKKERPHDDFTFVLKAQLRSLIKTLTGIVTGYTRLSWISLSKQGTSSFTNLVLFLNT